MTLPTNLSFIYINCEYNIKLVNHINLHKTHSNNNTILYCNSIEPGPFVIG